MNKYFPRIYLKRKEKEKEKKRKEEEISSRSIYKI